MSRSLNFLILLTLTLAACQGAPLPAATAAVPPVVTATPGETLSPSPTSSPEPVAVAPTDTLAPEPALTILAPVTSTAEATPLPASLGLDPSDWKNWPVLPIVSQHVREIYELGQTFGNDPNSFSVFGDCQAYPYKFLGVYDYDPDLVASLTPDLQQTVFWFAGSFNRMGPTIKGGTTTGALLWPQWHENNYTCTEFETPLECELRIHHPSFVFIHIGSHYESRDEDYMRKILDQLLAAGVVPILVTKGDDYEQDDHINASYARLAAEYNLPLLNFWAALKDLPNRGLYTRADSINQGDMYLTDQAKVIHRLTALESLSIVWRAATGFR